MGLKEDPYNYLLMPAISANVGGQIGSVVAGGIILTLVPFFA
jgi:oxaloacetate decarboxylase beta subunit